MPPPLRSTPTTRLGQNTLGRSLAAAPRRPDWQHPWFTEAQWQPSRKAWVGYVKAGFVNGVAPMVRTTGAELREDRGTFFGQLVDAKSGQDEILQLALLAIESDVPDDAQVNVPLYQRPPIRLEKWRALGGRGGGPVPEYFLERGVSKPIKELEASALGGVTVKLEDPPKGTRLLWACDIMVHQPRAALTSQMNFGAVIDGAVVNQTLGMREASQNDVLKIQTGTFDEVAGQKLDFGGATKLLDDYEERNWDLIKVSTVYLLSPPDPAPAAVPDERWQAFVSHSLFWNLHWSQPLLRDVIFSNDPFAPVRGTVAVLGGGAGFLWTSEVTASINDAMQGAFNLLSAKSLAGSFWTPTGGGTTSAWPATQTTPVKTGLDKAASATAKARAAAKKKRDLRLDPPFPFEGNKFNRSLLTI
jgi:hypothetical protein